VLQTTADGNLRSLSGCVRPLSGAARCAMDCIAIVVHKIRKIGFYSRTALCSQGFRALYWFVDGFLGFSSIFMARVGIFYAPACQSVFIRSSAPCCCKACGKCGGDYRREQFWCVRAGGIGECCLLVRIMRGLIAGARFSASAYPAQPDISVLGADSIQVPRFGVSDVIRSTQWSVPIELVGLS
jgi:hypothetical protein